MLKFKRLISSLLCFFILFIHNAANPMQILAEDAETFADENISVAIALGIFDEDSFERADENITRGEFFNAISRLLDAENIADKSPFKDLSVTHIYYDGICSAYSLGIINGYGDGTIHSDDEITVNVAVRLLTYVVGWKEAISNGMKMEYAASSSDICSSGDALSQEVLTVGYAAELLVNTGLAYVVQMSFAGERSDYFYSQETVFSKYLNVYRIEGVVTGNESTGLNSGYSNAGDGRVVIDGRLLFDKAGAGAFIGESVIAYCTTQDADNANTVIYVSTNKYRTEILTVNAKDEPEYSGGALNYIDKNGDIEKEYVNLSACDILYNGKCVIGDSSLLSPESGTVTLIDNDKDGNWDVVRIEEFKTYIVDNINELEDSIITKSGEIISLKYPEYFEMTEQSGEPAYLVELGEWDVLSVCESKDKLVLKICVAEKMLIGTLDSYSQAYVEIDGTEYEVSHYAASHQNEEFKSSISKRAIFRFDIDGRIACADFYSFTEDKYGYIMGWKLSEGIDGSIKVKLMSETGQFETCDVAEKIVMDGELITISRLTQWLKDGRTDSFSAEMPQLIVYRRNNDGKVTFIDTAYTVDISGNISANSPGYSESAEQSLHLFYDCYTLENGVVTENEQQSSLKYTSKGSKFVQDGTLNTSNNRMTVAKTYGLVLPFDAGTRVFVVPYDGNTDENSYRIMSMGEIADENDSSFFCRAYKRRTDSPVAEALLVLESDPKEVNTKSAPIVVSGSIRSGLNEDKDEVNMFRAYSETGEQEYITEDTSVLSNLSIKIGDVIRVKTDKDGVVTGCEKVYTRGNIHIEDYDSTDETDDPYCNTWTIRSAYRIRLANVYEVMAGHFVSTTEPLFAGRTYTPDYRYETRPISDYIILVYDSDKDILRTGTSADLTGFKNSGGSQWSKIFTYDKTGTGRIMVIYK